MWETLFVLSNSGPDLKHFLAPGPSGVFIFTFFGVLLIFPSDIIMKVFGNISNGPQV